MIGHEERDESEWQAVRTRQALEEATRRDVHVKSEAESREAHARLEVKRSVAWLAFRPELRGVVKKLVRTN